MFPEKELARHAFNHFGHRESEFTAVSERPNHEEEASRKKYVISGCEKVTNHLQRNCNGKFENYLFANFYYLVLLILITYPQGSLLALLILLKVPFDY